MPRRSKSNKWRSSVSKDIWDISSWLNSFDTEWYAKPDGTTLISSAAVDAYKAHRGGSYNKMLIELQPKIRKAYNAVAKGSKYHSERTKLGKTYIVIQAIRSGHLRSDKIFLLVRTVGKLLTSNIKTIEDMIAFGHLLEEK